MSHSNSPLFPSQVVAKGAMKLSSSFHLRRSDGTEINYVHVPFGTTLTRKARVTLHAGTKESDPVLAEMDDKGPKVALTTCLAPTGPSTHWFLDICAGGIWSSNHRVTGTLGPRGPQQTLEWRFVKGGVVKNLGGSGWELVRSNHGVETIVAALAMPTWSLNKRFTLALFHDALKGLGPDFEVMIVMTAIWIEKFFQESR